MKQNNTAIIHPSARIGCGVEVGPYAVIEADVEIGDNCVIGPHALIHSYTKLGSGCRIHANAVLGDTPQDTSFKECRSFVEIGKNCVLREGVTIHRGTEKDSKTLVGDNCFLMGYSHIAHNCIVGNRVIMANGALLAGRVELGDGVFMSGNASVHQFVKIGSLAMLSGSSGATKDVPPFCTLHGFALNQVSGLNVIGMRRAGMPPEDRKAVKRVFRKIYTSGLNVSQALSELAGEELPAPAAEFVDFVKNSKRGICRFHNTKIEKSEK
jgi:UDP-N-acetylglucosamine acyltransferase